MVVDLEELLRLALLQQELSAEAMAVPGRVLDLLAEVVVRVVHTERARMVRMGRLAISGQVQAAALLMVQRGQRRSNRIHPAGVPVVKPLTGPLEVLAE
jgi:hypothetical protein